jgi:tRNA dimethylallyltransferase
VSTSTGIYAFNTVPRVRITERLHSRLKNGMIEEVRILLSKGIPAETLVYYGLEYRFISRYLSGELSYVRMISLLNTAIHQFAKRQRTWFRKMEKEGTVIHWLEGEMPFDEKLERAVGIANTCIRG